MDETVLTSRRAWLRGSEGWIAGRLRLSDRRLTFVGEGTVVEVDLHAILTVRLMRWPRRALLVQTQDATHRLRCFAMPAVAALLSDADLTSARHRDTNPSPAG